MGKFADQLWADLVQEHGPSLAGAERNLPPRGRGRPAVLTAVGAFGVVGVATALALTLTATGASPAFAVTENANGSVTVTIAQLVGVSGANAELSRLGVRAKVFEVDPRCDSVPALPDGPIKGEPLSPGPEQDTVTIQPSAIPVGDTLVFAAEQISGNRAALRAVMVAGPAPSCYGGPAWRIKQGPGGRGGSTGMSGTRSASPDRGSSAPSH